MTVQIEDFETQNNVDKAVMHLNTTKLATLTDRANAFWYKSQRLNTFLNNPAITKNGLIFYLIASQWHVKKN